MPLYCYLNQKFPTNENLLVQELKKEITWIFLNFTSDDQDDRLV